jgi:hypothetical protein
MLPASESSGRVDGRINHGEKHPIIWAMVIVTFISLMAFFITSISASFLPSSQETYENIVFPYFFVLLLPVVLPGVPLKLLLIFTFLVLSLSFAYMIIETLWGRNRDPLATPVGFFIIAASAAYFLVFAISLIEEYSGVAIGGTTISNELVGKPFLTYSSLIFAPLAEETGFRILPLGLLTFFLVRYRRKSSHHRIDNDPGLGSQIVQSFLVPGRFRRTNGIYNLTAIDWTFVAITAGLFGLAHVLFGVWSDGKIITAGIVGVVLAVGFLKFGPYVDIPIHWVFNGVLTLYYVYSPLESATVLFALWLIATGIVSIIYVAAYLSRHGLRI